MMKLLILLAVAVAGVPTAHGQDSFPAVKGRVTDASTGQPTLEDTGIECLLTEQPDKSVALTMKNVKFTDNPREPVKTIVFPKLSRHNDDGSTIFESTGAIIPEIDDAPYEDYVISNFACEVTDNAEKFHLVFTCTNPTYHLNHTAEFNGTLIK